jgi:hypothetical protein
MNPTSDDNQVSLVDRIAKLIDRGGLGALSCPWLPAVSIFTDERYENYDFDMIGPRARLVIARTLKSHGFRQHSGRRFHGPGGWVEFPRATRTLASDPAAELDKVLDDGHAIPIATPTQVVLASWRRHGPALEAARFDQLRWLVRHQPANLDKVFDWLRRTPSGPEFQRHYSSLADAQEEGIEARRKGRLGRSARSRAGSSS